MENIQTKGLLEAIDKSITLGEQGRSILSSTISGALPSYFYVLIKTEDSTYQCTNLRQLLSSLNFIARSGASVDSESLKEMLQRLDSKFLEETLIVFSVSGEEAVQEEVKEEEVTEEQVAEVPKEDVINVIKARSNDIFVEAESAKEAKDNLAEYAKEEYNIDLKRNKSFDNMIEDLLTSI